MTLRVVSVDDEPIALQRVELALKSIPEAELVGQSDNGRRGLELIRSERPDIVLLDVQMPTLNGFEVLKALGAAELRPEVIFLTAYGQHAIQAFEVEAADYLLKPVSFARLHEAIRKAGQRLLARRADARIREMQKLLEDASATGLEDRHEQQLWTRDRQGLTRVPADTVEVFRADGDYVSARSGLVEHLLRDSIATLSDRLDPARLARVHRSAIVNLSQVRRVRRRSRRALVLILNSGEEVPVGPNYTDAVLAALGASRWR